MKTLFLIIVIVSCGFCVKLDTVTIKHKFYTTTYDTVKHYPVLVQWWMTQAMLSCSSKLERKEVFSKDPLLPAQTDVIKDYVNSGYDRGHNIPAFDNGCYQNGLDECFFMSNITPQTPALNRGDWKELEGYVRHKVEEYDSVYVWCGSVGSKEKIKRLTIPKYCWKIIYIKKTKKYEAFVFKNDTTKSTLEQHKTTVSAIYKLSGIKILYK
jgi:endonuclease G